MTRDVAYEEVQMRNRQRTDKLEQMEKYIQAKKEVRNIYKLRKRWEILQAEKGVCLIVCGYDRPTAAAGGYLLAEGEEERTTPTPREGRISGGL